MSVSAYHALNQRWAILADVTWTKWSRLDEWRIKFDNGTADSVDTLDGEDTWRYFLCGIFKPTEPLELRGALVGEYDASVDIISASVSFQF